MGGKGSTQRKTIPEEEGGYQDDHFPFFQLVQWSAEDCASNVIFTWDLVKVQELIGSLTQDVEAFRRICQQSLTEKDHFSMDDDTAYAEWAEALLQWSEQLRRVRFRLVPARMKEEVFWNRYFAGVRMVLQKELFTHLEDDSSDDDIDQRCLNLDGFPQAAKPQDSDRVLLLPPSSLRQTSDPAALAAPSELSPPSGQKR
mmetsp:Transcript_69723/g.167379  ORF Transcript_69723/g.167379 Transcript_69723/m.167379 type:complete len:200 (+) Transcript_69723:63-662(+)|eukprot:CAMPEP_0178379182 /NCGR_PEP_ID=MMETSP0689_2-20121128/4809_1 /TAXON_ID=160604 /ORGANISM="Amphidinium massartii, Strain CS-259" /LENGTH=199 /DNA_ID=CAMNT_0019999273 /DNA_START=58 /DNA_END=657 /DNA_ORIENTATION=+